MDIKQITIAAEQIAEEKGISPESVQETISQAIAAAYKKEHGLKGHQIKVIFSPEAGVTGIVEEKEVVEDELAQRKDEPLSKSPTEESEDKEAQRRFNPKKMVTLSEAKEYKKNVKVGDLIEIPLETTLDYGRIAAQTAKQVIIQRLRETERETVYEQFKEKEGEVVNAPVQREEKGVVFVDLEKTTGVLPGKERIPNENLRIGSRYRFLVVSVERSSKGPVITLSRNRPEFVKALFSVEVPEIASGSVEIKSIAREPGVRSKVAVAGTEPNIDPIGACVGQKGTRVGMIMNELNGENIDIIEWNEDHSSYIQSALQPAKVLSVTLDKEARTATVKVAEDQLSLAIGKNGQNVRLASKLTGWKIELVSETDSRIMVKKKSEDKKPEKKLKKSSQKNKSQSD